MRHACKLPHACPIPRPSCDATNTVARAAMRDHGAAAAGEDDGRTPPVARAFHTPPVKGARLIYGRRR